MIDVPIGEIFTISKTPTYPKLRILGGYVDMRDEIKNYSGNCINMDVDLMSVSDIATALKETDMEGLNEWVDGLKNKYL